MKKLSDERCENSARKNFNLRLCEDELKKINALWRSTTSRSASEYARKVLLQKPVIVNYRNESVDELLAEMIRLKNELISIGAAFNQAVRQLHTLDEIYEVKIWLIQNESSVDAFMSKTEEIRLRMIQIHEQWSQK